MGDAMSVCLLFSGRVLITDFFGLVVTFSISQVFIKEHRQRIKYTTSFKVCSAVPVSEWLESSAAAPVRYGCFLALPVNRFTLG